MADIFDFYVYDDRSIQFAIAEPIMLEDKDVTQFRFRIPKVLNNIDMTDWEWWFIFVNAKKVKYTTQLTLEDDEDDPDNFSVATYTVGYGFSGYVGSVSFSIEALNVSGEEIVNEWHTKTYSTAVIDTLQGLRAVIPEPDGQVSTGITEEVKQALLQIARKVAYIDEHGQTYYNALYDALYAITAVTVSPRSISLSAIGQTSQLTAQTTPAGGTITWSTSNASVATVSANGLVTATGLGSATITATSGGKSGTCSVLVAEATLTEISAVYTPSGTVYESDSLDSLKSRLAVTAHWSNGTTSEVASAGYTLSGTLTAGASTITVSYGDMTTTFEVTVVGLTGITATYTQSGTVYDTDTLDSLKSDLVVTANYSDGTSETVTDYTLSGTLAEGASTVTVSYGGKTATFNVTVTHYSEPGKDWTSGVPYDMTEGLTENMYLNNGVEQSYNGWSISPYMQCKGAFIESDTTFTQYTGEYDATDAYIRKDNIIKDKLFNFDEYGITSFRVSETTSKVTNAVITPYEFPKLQESMVWQADQYYTPSDYTAGGYINSSNGAIVSNNADEYSNYMNCYNASTIIDYLSETWRSYAFYDGNKEFISGIDVVRSDKTYGKQITVPNGARYFRVSKVTPSLGLCFKLN